MSKVKVFVVQGERDFNLVVGDSVITFKDGEAEVDSVSDAVQILKELEREAGIYKVEDETQEEDDAQEEDNTGSETGGEEPPKEADDDKSKKKKKNPKSKE